MMIHQWCQRMLTGPGSQTIIEAGAHHGEDTMWLAGLPLARVYALEPDPANLPLVEPPGNASWHQVAIGGQSGRRKFWPSRSMHGRPYSKSGSILRPTGHLRRHPDVKFGEPFEVDVVALDDFAAEQGIGKVAFQWWDVQGAPRSSQSLRSSSPRRRTSRPRAVSAGAS
jgi:FkbM family methyltransferase